MISHEKVKLMLVDDGIKNIEAAKEYFDTREQFDVTYFSKISYAKKAIDDNIKSNNPFNYAIFDLEMPDENGKIDPVAGHKLSVYAWQHDIPNFIVTQKYIHGNCASHSGDRTFYSWYAGADGFSLRGTKYETKTWKEVVESQRGFEEFIKKMAYIEHYIDTMHKKGTLVDLWDTFAKPEYRFLLGSHNKIGNAPMQNIFDKGQYTYD